MAKDAKQRGSSAESDQLAHASTRYNLEREPLHSEHSISRIQIPTQRTGWYGPRRRRMAAWLGVVFILLILLIGLGVALYGDKVWAIMIERWQ